MSEPRILTPTDRATIRQRWSRFGIPADVLALLDTCDEWDWPTGARAAQPQEANDG